MARQCTNGGCCWELVLEHRRCSVFPHQRTSKSPPKKALGSLQRRSKKNWNVYCPGESYVSSGKIRFIQKDNVVTLFSCKEAERAEDANGQRYSVVSIDL